MSAPNLDYNSLVSLYRRMRLIRRFEEHTEELLDAGEIRAHAHLYIGTAAALERDDVVTSTHRGHGHILAKGGDPASMFAELMGRETGTNRGRGGSMHIADVSLGIYGANGIVGAGAPMACGAAYMFRQRGAALVAMLFFGDGAMNQGVLLESLNLAAIWNLPVVFVCENNRYAITSPIADMARGSLADRAAAFGLAAETADGMDVEAVRDAADWLVARARSGGGAGFLECRTYRFEAHNTAMRGADPLFADPLFAGSALVSKKLTETESSEVIIALMSLFVVISLLPFALAVWRTPTAAELGWLFAAATVATLGHYTLTRAYQAVEITVTQPLSFLQLVWAALLGYTVFAEVPDIWTVAGSLIIVGSATYIAHREARLSRQPPDGHPRATAENR